VDYDDPLDVAEALVDIRTKTDQLMEVIGETDECLNALCNDVCGVSYDEDELIMGMFE
jgi:hypothetical protein